MALFRNAHECLHAVVARYAAIQTYTDVGGVRPIGTVGPASCWFETHFAAPERYRFQFVTPHPYWPLRHILTKSIIGSDGTKPYFYKHFPRRPPEIEGTENVPRVIASATGVSQGTAATVGKLFFPATRGFKLPDLLRPRFKRNREFDGVKCITISGRNPRGGRYTVWLGAEDLLLRKLVAHDFKREEIRHRIVVDEAVNDRCFEVPASTPGLGKTPRCGRLPLAASSPTTASTHSSRTSCGHPNETIAGMDPPAFPVQPLSAPLRPMLAPRRHIWRSVAT